MRKGFTLTGQELEIMKVVWQLKTATVRQVYETLLRHRKIAYTTVMTMMNILEQKGFLKKKAAERAFVYAPSRPERQVIRAMVREFVDRVFNGAAEPLLVHLVEDEQLTAEDLEELRRSIRPTGGKKLQ
ncbi:MAG TPA: BlaI/MecI/CopY family transcriptional regulator [Bryobacteraceae bacterium]|nr:BlaI/MecI/CopY family transcriptional regulator [Bryobacteraceae bacterium]